MIWLQKHYQYTLDVHSEIAYMSLYANFALKNNLELDGWI